MVCSEVKTTDGFSRGPKFDPQYSCGQFQGIKCPSSVLWALGTQVVCRYTCKQNTNTYKIKINKCLK